MWRERLAVRALLRRERAREGAALRWLGFGIFVLRSDVTAAGVVGGGTERKKRAVANRRTSQSEKFEREQNQSKRGQACKKQDASVPNALSDS